MADRKRQFSGRWFRFYEDTFSDPKIVALTKKQAYFLFGCWSLASKNGGFLPPLESLGKLLHFRQYEIPDLVAALRKGKEPLLDEIDGKLTPHNWHLRQFKSDCSTERTRKFRAENGQKTGENWARFEQKTGDQYDVTNSLQTKINPNWNVPGTAPEAEAEYIAAVVEVRSRPAPLLENSPKARAVIEACEPVTTRLNQFLAPALLGSVLAALGDAPASELADKCRKAGSSARSLGILVPFARDAFEQWRHRKANGHGHKKPPPEAEWEPDWVVTDEDRRYWDEAKRKIDARTAGITG